MSLSNNKRYFNATCGRSAWDTKQQQNPAELHHNVIKNSPTLAPPVFSSMITEPIKENCLRRANPQQGVQRSVPSPTPPSLHPPLVSSEQSSMQPELHTDTVALSTAQFTEQYWDTHTGKANRV